jgi:hypothetical protein
MTLFQFEMKKTFCYRHGILIFVLFLLVQLGLLWIGDSPSDLNAELYRDEYCYYLEQVSGPYTEEKADWLEAEADVITAAKQARDTLYQQYYQGKLSKTALQTALQPYEEQLKNENGFDVIYNQYLYICEGKENRCFLETNGWTGLLDNTVLDIPLLLALLLLVIPIFCGEYSCKMDALALTTKNGQRSYLRDKLFTVILITGMLCLSESFLRYGYYALRYGLPHGEYGMQSISIFGGSVKELSLIQAFLFLSISKWFGALYLSFLALAFSALSRQYSLTVLLSSASVLLPWLGLSEEVQYQLPLPLPFLLATGFLKGSETAEAETVNSQQDVFIFQEVTVSHIFLLWSVSMAVILLCFWILWRRHHVAFSCGTMKKFASILLPLLLVTGILTGCTPSVTSSAVCWNARQSREYYTSDFHVYYEEEEETIIAENLKTGEKHSIVRDALTPAKDISLGEFFYVDGNEVYYITTIREYYSEKAFSDTGCNTIFTLNKVDLDSFDTAVVYEHQDQSTILGINLKENDTLSFLFFNDPFFVQGNMLYVVEEQLYQIDMTTETVNTLNISSTHNIAFDGEYIYYVNSRYTLSRYELTTGTVTEWEEIAAYNFCITNDKVYYINLRDGNHLYSINKDGSNQQMEDSSEVLDVQWDGKTITITDNHKMERQLEQEST